MKLLLDRLRPFIASKSLSSKKAVWVGPSEEGPDACNFIVGIFTLSFKYLEMDLIGTLFAKASEKAEVKAQPQLLNKAFDLGKSMK